MQTKVIYSAVLTLLLSGCVSNSGSVSPEPVSLSADETSALVALNDHKLIDVVFAIQKMAEARSVGGRPVDLHQFTEALDRSLELTCDDLCQIKERN